MNPIRTNKPVFFGNDGEVLKSGKVYIGQPNQWPLSFPKTVTFQDSAGAQFTASQPLRTNKQGQISYNGKAIIALVDGDYSMLVQDRNGVQVNDGYTPFVDNTATGGGTESATQVGTLLTDIKQFNVTPGQTVRNVGQSTALDGLGADWLVVSNTGSPGDDVDLIDFANGTQGQRVGNVRYSKDIIEIEDGGTGAITAEGARAALDVYSTGEAISSAPGQVGSSNLANSIVTTDKLSNSSVTAAKLVTGNNERDWVLGRVSVGAAGAVGTYVFARSGGAIAFGATEAGSALAPAGIDTTGFSYSGTLSGTWRCMGLGSSAGVDGSVTLWLRIS